MSVSSPTPRANNSVASKIGVRISWKLYARNTSRTAASTKFHSAVSGGRRSRVPRTALIIASYIRRHPECGRCHPELFERTGGIDGSLAHRWCPSLREACLRVHRENHLQLHRNANL